MMWLGLEPGAARWKALANPLSYGGTQKIIVCFKRPKTDQKEANDATFLVNTWSIDTQTEDSTQGLVSLDGPNMLLKPEIKYLNWFLKTLFLKLQVQLHY